jgi:hypothetical protein
VLSSLVGCAEDVTEEGVARTSQAVVGVDEFLYLRCGATGWGADSTTLLAASSTPGVYTVEYDVTAPHMVTGGDQCVVTRTNSATGWGSVSASFGAASNTVVTAPGQWAIGAANSTPATVRYPALGRYRAKVNFGAGTVAIEAVDSAPPASSDYYYLRCNATGWGVASTNRLQATGNTGLSLSYSVNQAWMVSGGDQCVVTRTNQLDGWGSSQATLGTSSATTLVVPNASSASTTLVAPGQQFTVRYPAQGQYQARFNPTTGELRISVPGSDVPETGLHGAVESLGGNRVRISYDFQSAAQLEDFVSTDITATAVAIEDGRLLVRNVASQDALNAAALVKGIKIDSVSYQAELVSGTHIGVYPGLVWDGSWSPKRGYGAVQRADGRWMMANGQFTFVGSGAAVPGVVHQGLVTTNEQGFTWTLDGDAKTLTFPYYGGTSRSFALGGFGSTVAFDNLVIEGTVDGFDSDGTETNPDVIHGAVENLSGGRVRITYDFSNVQQKYDFIVNDAAGTRRELNDGRLIVSHGSVSSDLKVALYKYNLRVDRLSYRAELLAGDHVNLYLNTIWDGNWAPSVGCVGIHREDGRIIAVNGTAIATADTTPVATRTVYAGDVVLDGTGLDWTVNGAQVSLDTACYSGNNGTFGIGSYGSDVAFDQIVIEGVLQ